MNKTTTIVIATLDRPGFVLDCVKSFRAQIPSALELLVVDAGTESPVDESALKTLWPNSRVIRSSIRNAGVQRNEGVRQAAGDIIIFLDDDCYVQPGWWPAIIEPLDDVDVAAVAGAIWCNPNPTLISKRGGYVNAFGVPVQVTHRNEDAPKDVDWALTTNMAVRKNVFLAVGGFAEVYGIYDEDVDLGLKIRRGGGRIVFQAGAAVYHYFTKTPRKPQTKHGCYLLGRNRSMLIVRNYGVSYRLFLFLLTAPMVKLFEATVKSGRAVFKAYGHAVAYLLGTIKGVVDGIRNPVRKD